MECHDAAQRETQEQDDKNGTTKNTSQRHGEHGRIRSRTSACRFMESMSALSRSASSFNRAISAACRGSMLRRD
jgi:hypothetical protein